MSNKKKTKILHWTAVLVFLDIATICIISSIYIRFVNAATTSVASIEKWGIRITAPANTIAKSYSSSDGNSVTVYTHTNLSEIIAPGKMSDINLGHFTVSGLTSDQYSVKCTSTVTLNNWWYIDDEKVQKEYCPIAFKVGDNVYRMSGTDSNPKGQGIQYANTKSLGDAVASAIVDMYEHKGTYQPNGDSWYITYQDISWSWDYYVDELQDQLDTALGNHDLDGFTQPTIDIVVTLTVDWEEPSASSNNDDDDDDNSSSTSTPPQTISGNVETIVQPSTEPAPDETISGSIVKTGDNFNIVMWISIMVISATVAIVMIILLFARRRRAGANDENKE